MIVIESVKVLFLSVRLSVVALATIHACHLIASGSILWTLVLSNTQEAREAQGNPLLWINLEGTNIESIMLC